MYLTTKQLEKINELIIEGYVFDKEIPNIFIYNGIKYTVMPSGIVEEI